MSGVLLRALCAAAVVSALLLTTACRPEVRGNHQNVLLVTLETTRADHLGAYGYSRDTSPRLDALARGAVLFERLSTVSPRTNPSLASLMTSRFPHEHGVRNLLLPLEPENRTLAEILRASGYVTGAVQTHPRLVASSGFAQGFDTYDDAYAEHPLADQACGVARDWIDRRSRGARPWFLWLHLMDPHWTYAPPPAWRAFGPPDPRPGRLYRALEERRERIGRVIFQNAMTPSEVQAFVDLYDAEIRFTDSALGALLDFLDARGLSQRTVVLVTADHGESLGEHRYFFEHGDLGTQPEIHIPLIVRAPRLPAGRRIPWTVSSLDVAPTALDLVGISSEGAFRGTSLVPLVGEGGEDRSCMGETDQSLHEENDRREVEGLRGKWRWCRRGGFKLLHIPQAFGPPLRILHDLEADPGERQDFAAAHPEVRDALARELDAFLSEDKGQDREYHITDSAREILRSLGYVN